VRVTLALLSLALVAGCSATSNDVAFSGSGTGAETTGTGASTGTGGSGTGSHGHGGGSGFDAGAIPEGGPMGPAEVFGHSPDTLYKLDPVTKVVTLVAPFQGCDTSTNAVIDLALDKDGSMYVTTFGGFYKVDKTTAVCTHLADGPSYPTSLTFVPKGTVDQNVEALVGYELSSYVRIDPITGVISTIGSLGTQGYYSSGDIVSVIGGGTYLTVQGGPENCDDCLIEVDPTTGAFVKMIAQNLGHADVYGIAFWGGTVYGFDDSGHLFAIDITNGTHTDIPIPNTPPGLFWFGAGSTTSAPLTPTQ
jgi:hypothetical protein